ncbi:MAG: hypothetical protein LBD03_01685, partial [Methanobrevibacter sp.]|nr:hypothetical protein [Candidatus Methanovirga procula]
MEQNRLTDDFWAFEPIEILNLKDKIMEQGTPLKEIENVNIYGGILTGYNKAFIVDEETKNDLIATEPKNSEIIKFLLRGRDIHRWNINYQSLYLLYIPWDFEIGEYPDIKKHLLKFKDKLSKRPEVKGN